VDLTKIGVGPNPPHEINVIIEIPQGGVPIKYQLDEESGALYVDRFLHTSMVYPANYGFIPHTLAPDGDACDALVISQFPVMPGTIVRCRPLGALKTSDESGADEKILTVPVDKLDPFFKGLTSYADVPHILREQIAHFFCHYKDLEEGKWTVVSNWLDVSEALQLIERGIERARQTRAGAKNRRSKAGS
jgi:inorganic pyrophosphatase